MVVRLLLSSPSQASLCSLKIIYLRVFSKKIAFLRGSLLQKKKSSLPRKKSPPVLSLSFLIYMAASFLLLQTSLCSQKNNKSSFLSQAKNPLAFPLLKPKNPLFAPEK